MYAPNGDLITQFDLHDCEDCSLIKIDLLSVECLDKIHETLDLLIEDGRLTPEKTLKETYEKAIGIYNLERDDPKMWEMLWNHEIQSLFQMEKQSGVQGIELIHPKSIDELAVLNSVMRLMAPDANSDQPLETWAKYRKDIGLWYKEMRDYGLTTEQIDWLSHHPGITEGICESQEGLMSLVQEERLGGNSLSFADKCRKGIAKKQGSLFEECEQIFFKNIKEKSCSEKLAHYVWDVLLRVQRGYSFNRSHCLAYSLVALQEMNLAYKYPLIYWNTACLITESGGSDNSLEEIVDIYEPEQEDMSHGYTYKDLPDRSGKIKKSSAIDYNKFARAIGRAQKSGSTIALPDINKSKYTFSPDVENNRIYFGLRGILNIGEEVVNTIIANRPYSSFEDFINKVPLNKSGIVSLIKCGAFDEFEDRKSLMLKYLTSTINLKNKLNLTSLSSLLKYNLIPIVDKDIKFAYSVYEFNRYLKAKCKLDPLIYTLDERAIAFLQKIGQDNYIMSDMTMATKIWDKYYQKVMDIFRKYLSDNQEALLNKLNQIAIDEVVEKYASGSVSAWEMEVICFYYHEHELAHVNKDKYGCKDFEDLAETPKIEKEGVSKTGRVFRIYDLTKICGTVIAKDKPHHVISLLTTGGVVDIKFSKDVFSNFDKRITEVDEKGKSKIKEKSWFDRGSLLMVQGYRNGDYFVPKKYKNSVGAMLYKINEVYPNGDLKLTQNRYEPIDIENCRRRN